MISVQQQDFDLATEYAQLRAAAGDAGAIVTFTGLVRELYDLHGDGQEPITALNLEHYPGMTEKALQGIVDQANGRWRLLASRIIHRVGRLQAGDQIVLVGTASAHRQDAFAAADFIMDYLKSQAPFWKKQETPRGSHWVEPRPVDETAMERWQNKDN